MHYSNQRIPSEVMQNPYMNNINQSKPNQYSEYTPYNYHNNNIQSPKRMYKDGPSETLNLNDNVSFARNFKSRLFNVDPQQQLNKHKVQDKYREELWLQMEDDKRRKAEKKAKQDEQDMRWEQNFNEKIRIEAQQRANKKQQPNYFVVRSARGKRNDLKQSKIMNNSLVVQSRKTEEIIRKDNLQRTIYAPPLIIKRGGYHNQSSLDNNHSMTAEINRFNNPEENIPQKINSPQPISHKFNVQQNLTSQLAVQQDRISKLLIFQQNILKKLDFFKRQIHQTGNVLKIDDQYQRVKLRLRAKSLNMQKIYSLSPYQGLNDVLNNSEIYKLPLISKKGKIYQGQRQIRKQQKKSKKQKKPDRTSITKQKQIIHLQDRAIHTTKPNDKNILQIQESEQNQPNSVQE